MAGAGAAYAITGAVGIHFTTSAGVAYTAGAVVTHDATGVGAMYSTTSAQVPLILQTTVSKPALQEHL